MSGTDALTAEVGEPGPKEIEFDRVACARFDHEAVISADADMAIVRIRGKGASAVYIGVTPERALRLSAAFARAAVRIRPALRLQLVEDAVGEQKTGGET